jgi:hypothetical protein
VSPEGSPSLPSPSPPPTPPLTYALHRPLFSSPTRAGHGDAYTGNYLWLTQDGSYGSGQTCSGAGMTIVGGNTIWSPTGAVSECGTTLPQWQAQGNDPGTTAAAWPADSAILTLARSILGMTAA